MRLFEPRDSRPATISAADLRDHLSQGNRPTILDVRTAAEFVREGHVPGAVHLPLHRLVEEIARLEREAEYIVVCRSGARSAEAQRILLRAGFGNVRNMAGGMLRWHGPVAHDGPVRR